MIWRNFVFWKSFNMNEMFNKYLAYVVHKLKGFRSIQMLAVQRVAYW